MQLGTYGLFCYVFCAILLGCVMLCYAEIGSKVTGTLGILRRVAAKLAATAGCDVRDGVRVSTTIGCCDQDDWRLAGFDRSAKHRKAEVLRNGGQSIRIIGETDFLRMLDSSQAFPSRRLSDTADETIAGGLRRRLHAAVGWLMAGAVRGLSDHYCARERRWRVKIKIAKAGQVHFERLRAAGDNVPETRGVVGYVRPDALDFADEVVPATMALPPALDDE